MDFRVTLGALTLLLIWAGAEVKAQNYRDALTKSILFFEGQRSGKLPPNQRMKWRGDSGLSDGSSDNVDLSGGYHDAGDNVKFGLPMAFTTTMLSWSVLEFGQSMGADLENAEEAIRWGADYLLKATANPGVIYVQVAEPNQDHQCWERPEDMDTNRNAYKIDTQNPGSDVAAETAAALAAASLVFKETDASYSNLLLQRAMQVFDFADKYRGAYSNSLSSEVCPFYCSYSGYNDELLWGAAWLQKASGNASFVNYLQTNAQSFGATDNANNVLSWDQKLGGTRVLLAGEFKVNNVQSLQQFGGPGDNVICSLQPGNAKYTPGGLLFNSDQSNIQYVTSMTFLLFTYAKYLSASKQVIQCGNNQITADTLQKLGKQQIDYILGNNPMGMSYMVGYGTKFPQHIHHRGASLPSIFQRSEKIGCKDGFELGLNNNGPDPNVLVGAVVGPDANDQFRDDRNDYSHSEPTTYINAPLVGALAYLVGA